MPAAEKSVTIRRTPEDVYAFIADGLNNKLWRPSVKSVSLASGDAGQVGAVYAQRLAGPGGREIDGDYRIVEATPSESLRFEVVAGPARPKGTFTLRPTDDGGTALSFGLAYEPKGFMKLMGGMIQKTMDSEVKQLETLKAVLEQ
ncbi:SRPBCC family protein [Sinomonas sp. JGH33]|uniref:SRPBCC family protein n=1 Tax=Sinomonas terricola TaxID=3110330 RepID=A0ABU5TBY8_9MICC|nr:SRPBCC family protein [Sinomonas sp. JGH33]MEA5457203.1 SRPBCC family protein [Sinomonas sp. JGH33]